MAYDREETYKLALSIIDKDEDCVFANDVIAELGIAESTYYSFFEPKSKESESIKEKLEANRSRLKKRLRGLWYKSSSAATQIALYKLLCLNTKDEARALSNQNVSVETNTENPIFPGICLNVITPKDWV